MSEIMERHTKKVKTSKSDLHIANFLKNTQIHNDTDLMRLTEYAENLADILEAGNNEIESLFDYVVNVIEAYEDLHYPIGKSSPVETLKFLMDQHGHLQKDLTDVAPKSTISEILSGKKEMSKTVIRKLAEKYHTNPSVFF
jgi:HTH-type transcriptional regulator/antitoxin HigA